LATPLLILTSSDLSSTLNLTIPVALLLRVAVAIKFVLEHPDTILLVTADHDTGGMTLKDGWDEYLKKCAYTTGGHSANNIPVYAIGYGTEVFNGQVFQNNYIGRILGNLMGDTGFGDSTNDPMVILDGGQYGSNLVAALVDTDKTVGECDDKLYAYNVLSTEEKDTAIEAATTVIFAPETMDTTEAAVVKAGDKLAQPAALVSNVAGYEFAGWFKDEACTTPWNFDTDVVAASGDTVLYAGWKVATVTEEPKVEEPKVEEPKVEEPKVEEPKVEEPKTEEPTVQAGREVKAGEQVHVVQKGECLWGLATKYLGDGRRYTELFARNSDILTDAEIIGIGQEIIIPAK